MLDFPIQPFVVAKKLQLVTTPLLAEIVKFVTPISIQQRTIDIDSNAKNSPIHIGKYVFIGADSILMKGITVGDFAVIGAGSVVRTNIPENEVWAGNPAVFVKKISK